MIRYSIKLDKQLRGKLSKALFVSSQCTVTTLKLYRNVSVYVKLFLRYRIASEGKLTEQKTCVFTNTRISRMETLKTESGEFLVMIYQHSSLSVDKIS